MSAWLLAAAVAAFGAWLAYGPLGQRGIGRAVASPRMALVLGLLRGLAYLLLLAILFGAPFGRSAPPSPLVVLDASSSWQRAASPAWWTEARDSANALAGDSVLLAGDSARLVARAEVPERPADARSSIASALELAQTIGRPAVLITDGEVDDPEIWQQAPPGSRRLTLARPAAVDVGLSSLEAPTIATGGDTIEVIVGVAAGTRASDAGILRVTLGGVDAAQLPVAPLDAGATRQLAVRVPLSRGNRRVELAAMLDIGSDVESRNDTLRRMLDINDRPRAVFVSTAPDLDVREVLRVLRGTLAVPTRAYLRVAPGTWREEGTLAPIAEAEVQRRASAAGLLVLHGDTAWGGVITNRRGPLLAWASAPPAAAARAGAVSVPDEWFVARALPSPLSSVLSVLPFDSLPPIAVRESVTGGVPLLEAKRGRQGTALPIAMVQGEGARRQVRLAGSGFAAWVQRGGAAADAFSALWGAIFDWAAAAEGAVGGVRPAREPLRAGEPIRWVRGTEDTLVSVRLEAIDREADVQTFTLAFGTARETAESAPLAEGRYRVRIGDDTSSLVVNPAREWVPQAPRLRSLVDSGSSSATPVRSPSGPRRPLRDAAWPFIAALLVLCAEWLARRAAGLR